MYRQYRFRAECFTHFDNFRDKLDITKVRSYKIEFEFLEGGLWIPDVEVSLVTLYSLEQLLGKMSQVTDGHVMYESLNYEKPYMGDRLRDFSSAGNIRYKIPKPNQQSLS